MIRNNKVSKECLVFPERNFFPSLRLVERFEDKVPFVLGLNIQIQFAYALRSDILKRKPEAGILILEIP